MFVTLPPVQGERPDRQEGKGIVGFVHVMACFDLAICKRHPSLRGGFAGFLGQLICGVTDEHSSFDEYKQLRRRGARPMIVMITVYPKGQDNIVDLMGVAASDSFMSVSDE